MVVEKQVPRQRLVRDGKNSLSGTSLVRVLGHGASRIVIPTVAGQSACVGRLVVGDWSSVVGSDYIQVEIHQLRSDGGPVGRVAGRAGQPLLRYVCEMTALSIASNRGWLEAGVG